MSVKKQRRAVVHALTTKTRRARKTDKQKATPKLRSYSGASLKHAAITVVEEMITKSGEHDRSLAYFHSHHTPTTSMEGDEPLYTIVQYLVARSNEVQRLVTEAEKKARASAGVQSWSLHDISESALLDEIVRRRRSSATRDNY